MSKSSYDSIKNAKVVFIIVLLILFYWIHIYSDNRNREQAENYIIEQMLLEYPYDVTKLELEMKNKSSSEICNNKYINIENLNDFKYCIAHRKNI